LGLRRFLGAVGLPGGQHGGVAWFSFCVALLVPNVAPYVKPGVTWFGAIVASRWHHLLVLLLLNEIHVKSCFEKKSDGDIVTAIVELTN
jgi:hypothetical protein